MPDPLALTATVGSHQHLLKEEEEDFPEDEDNFQDEEEEMHDDDEDVGNNNGDNQVKVLEVQPDIVMPGANNQEGEEDDEEEEDHCPPDVKDNEKTEEVDSRV